MTQRQIVKQKTQNLKTQINFNGTLCQLQFGKPIRLPYIKKSRYSYKLQGRNLHQKDNLLKQQKKTNRQMQMCSQLNLMTLQQIQLCENVQNSLERKRSVSKFLPKISFNLKKQRILNGYNLPSQARLQRMHSQQSITKTQLWQSIGQYSIGPVIGRGSYSMVRLARNQQRKRFAIKIYSQRVLQDGDRKRNLQREIEILYQINHPNLVKFYQTIHTSDSVYIVTELLQCVSIAQYMKIQQLRKLQQGMLRDLMRQVLVGFNYLHQKEIVHRDVKMENILVDEKINVKIIDFGFGVKLNKGEVLYDFCGTPHYLAPQVIRKKGYYGKQADIWSLGVLLYKLATGVFPFKGLNQKNLFNKILKGEYKHSDEISVELMDMINRMMNVDYEKRPTAKELLEDKWVLGGEGKG